MGDDMADPDRRMAVALEPFGARWEGGGMDLPLPPPWFLPVEAPACEAELHVPAEATNDGIERRFRCDLQAGHAEHEHRQVVDNDEGRTLVWPVEP